MTTAQGYGVLVLALGAWYALAGRRQALSGDLIGGTLGGGVALGMIMLALVVR